MDDLQKEADELIERCRVLDEEYFEPMVYPVRELCNLIRKQAAIIERATKWRSLEQRVDGTLLSPEHALEELRRVANNVGYYGDARVILAAVRMFEKLIREKEISS